MGNYIDKRSILDRIKDHYSLKGNADLARFLEVSPNTITNWYKRQTFDIDVVLSKCTDLDLNWLLTGREERIKDVPPFCHVGITQNEDTIKRQDCTNSEYQKNKHNLSHENESPILENNQNMNTDFEPLMNGTTKKEKNTENKNERKVLISSNIPPVSRAGYNDENIDWEEFYKKQDIINKFLVIYKHKNISFDYEDISGDFSLCWSYMLHYSISQQLDHIAGKYLHGEIGIDAFSEAFKTTINKVSNFLQVIEPYRNQLKELQEKLHQFDIENDKLFWFNEE